MAILDKFFGYFSHDIGIDLGTANTLVYLQGKGIIMTEPSVVAVNQKTGQVVAIGEEARKMIGRTPGHIVAIRPLVEGVISDFEVTEEMLSYFIRRAHSDTSKFLARPKVVIGIPSGITEVERRAVHDAAKNAGAREVYLVEEPMAAAIGARLEVQEAGGKITKLDGSPWVFPENKFIASNGVFHDLLVAEVEKQKAKFPPEADQPKAENI